MQSSRQQINLIGGGFQHSLSSSGHEPIYIEWIKNDFVAPISFYVDFAIKSSVNDKTKNYGWLAESKTINPELYFWCKANVEELKFKFDAIFTHDVELSIFSDLFILTQCSAKSFLQEHRIYEKNKLVSMIASNKNFCEEHKFRLGVIEKYSKKCDHFGWGYNQLTDKSLGLKDYCFSFAIENATYSNMFTEKITDCFVTGTIPIYYGMNNINRFFNPEGIIFLDENFNFDDLTFELYYEKMPHVKENFEISKNLLCAEDYIFINFIK